MMQPYSAALNSLFTQQNHTIPHRQIKENTVYEVHNHSWLLLLHPAIDFHPHHIATVTPCLTKPWLTSTKLCWLVVFTPSMPLSWCAPCWRLWPGHDICLCCLQTRVGNNVMKKCGLCGNNKSQHTVVGIALGFLQKKKTKLKKTI